MTTAQETIPFTEALQILREALKSSSSNHPTLPIQQLDISSIATMEAVFQPRLLDGRYAEEEAHIKTLASAIGSRQRPSLLHPITVWWGGDRWYVIDGHHRLKAYKRVGVSQQIPVVVFIGSLDEAMAQSAAANSKDHLVMRLDDKLNAAWRLVLFSTLSKAQIAAACAVANGTVGNMRKVKEVLLADPDYTLEYLCEMQWRDAKMDADGISRDPGFDPDEAVKKRADIYRRALIKALGNRPFADTEAFGLALLNLDLRLPVKLMQTAVWFAAVRQAISNMNADAKDAAAFDGDLDMSSGSIELAMRWNAAEANSDY